MRNTSALHWTLLVALLASPVVASAQKTTDVQEPVASPPPTPNTTSDQAEQIGVQVLDAFQDRDGNYWFGTGDAVCRYDGETFTAFREDQDLMIYGRPAHANVQDMFEDRDGILWFACSGGLFRRDGESFVNVTRNGPWPAPAQP